MQVTLFKALRSIAVDDDRATAVVDDLEAFVSDKVEEGARRGVEPLAQRITSLEAKIDAQGKQIAFTGTLLAIIGLAIAAGPIVLHFVH